MHSLFGDEKSKNESVNPNIFNNLCIIFGLHYIKTSITFPTGGSTGQSTVAAVSESPSEPAEVWVKLKFCFTFSTINATLYNGDSNLVRWNCEII